MNNEFDRIEEELKSLHPRGLSRRAVAQIRDELEPATHWPWWLALGTAAAAGVVVAFVWLSAQHPKTVIAEQAESVPVLVLSRHYDGVVLLDHKGPYRQTRYHIARNGANAEVVVLQKASLD